MISGIRNSWIMFEMNSHKTKPGNGSKLIALGANIFHSSQHTVQVNRTRKNIIVPTRSVIQSASRSNRPPRTSADTVLATSAASLIIPLLAPFPTPLGSDVADFFVILVTSFLNRAGFKGTGFLAGCPTSAAFCAADVGSHESQLLKSLVP